MLKMKIEGKYRDEIIYYGRGEEIKPVYKSMARASMKRLTSLHLRDDYFEDFYDNEMYGISIHCNCGKYTWLEYGFAIYSHEDIVEIAKESMMYLI